MALARIFSRYPEQTTTLSQQLQQQGYRVEVLSPEQAPTTVADLEIQLEVCDPVDVLRRAAELATRLRADIVIAPGALASSEPKRAEQEPAPTAPFSATVEVTASTEAPIPPVTIETEPECDAVAAAVPSRLTRAARGSGTALAICVAAAEEFLVSAGAAFRERLEEARALASEARTKRRERLLELTRRRAEAQQQAVSLENSRRALSGYLSQLQRSYPEELPRAGVKLSVGIESLLHGWQAKIQQLNVKRWAAVLAGVVSAVGLFALGMALASFHASSSPPASTGSTTGSSGVTLQGQQAKPVSVERPSPAVRKATVPQTASKTHTRRTARNVGPRTTPQRSQNLVASDVTVRRFPAAKPAPSPQANGWKHFSDTSN
jgi:hypothetical protein